jgi:lipopolysaccharide export system ATP-binding protein
MAALMLLAATPGAWAQQGGAGGNRPVEIVADKLVVDQDRQLATFSGNVDAVQGDMNLRANQLRVFYVEQDEPRDQGKPRRGDGADASASDQSIRRIEAEGDVLLTRPGETAEGDAGVYDPIKRTLVLEGNVVLTRAQNVIRGTRLDSNLETGVSVVTAAGASATSACGRCSPPSRKRRVAEVGAAPDLLVENRARRAARAARPGAEVAGPRRLAARSLAKHYRDRIVLRDVSLALHRGEAVGLLGPNGAGKTTCFYIITGLIAADRGQVLLDDRDVTALAMYRRARLGIGYLPQEASIFRGLNVEDNIRAVLQVADPSRDRREALLEQLLEEFALAHLRRVPALALSGGERRRVEIARALAANPGFILLDEPLAGIDPINVGEIRDLVSHLKDRGLGVLITDHNVRDTLEIIDRAYILHDGAVLREGTPAEIVADPAVRRVYLGERFSL